MPVMQVVRPALPYDFCRQLSGEGGKAQDSNAMSDLMRDLEAVCRLKPDFEFVELEASPYPGDAKRKLRRVQ